ncbi:MAG: CarD family transcriptional regulator [Hyphomicrobiaceae bacterium]|nr:MAG: CarD family transcriptional regulator [Hyphomicrobiaceae bacterium]
MARKKTSGKSAAQKSAVKHVVRKVSTRASAAAKTAARKGPPAKVQQAKHPTKPVAAKVGQANKGQAQVKKPAAVAKPVLAKTVSKAVPGQVPTAGKPMPPKAVALKHAIAAAASRQAAAVPTAARTIPAAVNKAAGQKITAPATPVPAAAQAAAAQAAASKKPVNQRHGFKTNEWIVYPAHGVGRIVGIEEQEIAGISLELFVITFEKDKMTLRVPTGKSQSVGMRKLAEEGIVKRAMETLKGKARIKRTMWSRRAQEYEAKINSGDLIAIAEVVRDLYRSESQPEQSYSERQLYEAALDRMAREIAAVEKLDERGAIQRITEVLSKSAKGRRVAADEAEIKAA